MPRSFPLSHPLTECCQTTTNLRCDRHGLSVHHVRAVGIQIQAKVRETGHQVDVNGTCWASRVEINHPAVGEQLQHDLCNHARGHVGQQEPRQDDWEGQSSRVWPRNDTGDADINNGGGSKNINAKPRADQCTSVANSVHEDWRRSGRRQQSGGQRRRNRRRRSWQGYYSTDEDDQYCSSGDHDDDQSSLSRSRRSSDEERGTDLQAAPPFPPPPALQPPGETTAGRRLFSDPTLSPGYA